MEDRINLVFLMICSLIHSVFVSFPVSQHERFAAGIESSAVRKIFTVAVENGKCSPPDKTE